MAQILCPLNYIRNWISFNLIIPFLAESGSCRRPTAVSPTVKMSVCCSSSAEKPEAYFCSSRMLATTPHTLKTFLHPIRQPILFFKVNVRQCLNIAALMGHCLDIILRRSAHGLCQQFVSEVTVSRGLAPP